MIDAKVKDGRLSLEISGTPSTIMADMTQLLTAVCRNIGRTFPNATAEEKKAVSGIVLDGIIAAARETIDWQPDSEIVVKKPTKPAGEA